LAAPDNLIGGAKSVVSPYDSLTGFSVSTAPGMSVQDLANIAQYPNNIISYTTVDALAVIGVPVVPTPFPGMPIHGTAVVPIPLDPARAAEISSVFQQIPNPAR
jgi:hypothetical protein